MSRMKRAQYCFIACIAGIIIAVVMIQITTLSAFAETKSDGDRKVGTLTLSAYTGNQVHWMPHGILTLTTYEDLEMNVSCYMYYKPNEKYEKLMEDHADHPEKYRLDPALYNRNIPRLDDRDSYFDAMLNGSYSEPVKVSLKAGESITIANSALGEMSIENLTAMLEDSTIATSKEAAGLIEQLHYYMEGSDHFDKGKTAAGFVGTFIKAYKTALETGHNPVDGRLAEGGLFINKELHDQFVSEVSRLPNNYYTVEITADELAVLKEYVSDPANNYFSFLDRNCTYVVSDIWNRVFADKPELKVNPNYTGFATDPESLYMELWRLRDKEGIEGYGGRNFTPRTIAYRPEKPSDIKAANTLKVQGKTASVRYSRLKKKQQTLKAGKVIKTIKAGQGTLSYKLNSAKKGGKSFSKYFKVAGKTGTVTVRKGLKKGTYNVKIKVRASGDSSHKKSSWKTVTSKIRVK